MDKDEAEAGIVNERYYCPFPGCKRSFAELWRLKVHYRAPPDIRGSGKERGHGCELTHCPKCGKGLKPGKHHVGCSGGKAAPRAAKRSRMAASNAAVMAADGMGHDMQGMYGGGMVMQGSYGSGMPAAAPPNGYALNGAYGQQAYQAYPQQYQPDMSGAYYQGQPHTMAGGMLQQQQQPMQQQQQQQPGMHSSPALMGVMHDPSTSMPGSGCVLVQPDGLMPAGVPGYQYQQQPSQLQPMPQLQQGMEMQQPMMQPGMEMQQPMMQPSMDMQQPMLQPSMDMQQPMLQPSMDMQQPMLQPSMDMQQPMLQPGMEMQQQPLMQPGMDMQQPMLQQQPQHQQVGGMMEAGGPGLQGQAQQQQQQQQHPQAAMGLVQTSSGGFLQPLQPPQQQQQQQPQPQQGGLTAQQSYIGQEPAAAVAAAAAAGLMPPPPPVMQQPQQQQLPGQQQQQLPGQQQQQASSPAALPPPQPLPGNISSSLFDEIDDLDAAGAADAAAAGLGGGGLGGLSGRAPSPPPLPADFPQAVGQGTLFNFAQFSHKLPAAGGPSQQMAMMPRGMQAELPPSMDELWTPEATYDHHSDGDLMQLLFGAPEQPPTMATIHLHHFLEDDACSSPLIAGLIGGSMDDLTAAGAEGGGAPEQRLQQQEAGGAGDMKAPPPVPQQQQQLEPLQFDQVLVKHELPGAAAGQPPPPSPPPQDPQQQQNNQQQQQQPVAFTQLCAAVPPNGSNGPVAPVMNGQCGATGLVAIKGEDGTMGMLQPSAVTAMPDSLASRAT